MPYLRKRRYPYKSCCSGYRAKRYRGLTPTYRGFAGPQQLKAEWKYLDTPINQPINTTGAQTLLNALAPGSGASQRIGMKVSIRSVQFRLFPYAINGTGVDQFARLCIFWIDSLMVQILHWQVTCQQIIYWHNVLLLSASVLK